MAQESANKVPDAFKSVINKKGEFVRNVSSFRNWVTADGSSGFKAEAYRYHLYVSYACPWASRTLIVRKLKGLENIISMDCVHWFLRLSEGVGWEFKDQNLDTVNNCQYIREIYQKAQPDYDGRWTVPVLWDKVEGTIVSNESSEIIRMLNSEFNEFCPTTEQRELDLYPEHLRQKIDEINDYVYPNINNGVYRSGFARSQEAYNEAVVGVFKALDRVEDILSKSRYLVGNQLTEADIRLFTTLIRFDMVYHQHFKCNKKRIIDYPNLWNYTRNIYQIPGVAETVNMEHITNHYMQSHTSINPCGIVCIGPDLDFMAPHDRNKFVK